MTANRWLMTAIVVFLALGTAGRAAGAEGEEAGKDSEPQLALEGWDPIELLADELIQGKPEHSFVHKGFRYLFKDGKNQARFASDPDRYGIQGDGSCTVMGEGVEGDPKIFTTYEGRIYIFGTLRCMADFLKKPGDYVRGEGGG